MQKVGFNPTNLLQMGAFRQGGSLSVKRKDDGFYVRHKYRAKNGFGGYVVANQLFHLDFSGNVVDVKDLY